MAAIHKLFTSIEEHVEPVEGRVKGSVPKWIKGGLYRNGPGLYEVGEQKFQHGFDPLSIIQRFYIEDGRVFYQSKYLRGDAYKKAMKHNKIIIGGFATCGIPDPCKNIFARFLSSFAPESRCDNDNVNLFPIKDEIWVATETNMIRQIDHDTLETPSKVNLHDQVGTHTATAHFHWEEDGTVHNIGYNYAGRPKLILFKFPSNKGKAGKPAGEVAASLYFCTSKMNANYSHSFAMTQNYYIFIEQPLFINVFRLLTAFPKGRAFDSSLEWCPEVQNRFRIIDRRTGKEVNRPGFRYWANTFMMYHTINAYEENGHIILDLVGYPDNDLMEFMYLKNLTSDDCLKNWRKISEPEGRRYVIPLEVDSEATPMDENLVMVEGSTARALRTSPTVIHCIPEPLASIGFEFPQINYEKYNMKKYQYTYGTGWHNDGEIFNTVAKIDVQNKTHVEWSERDCYPSEPAFIPNPNGTEEDDGVVVAAVNQVDQVGPKGCFFLVLDAKTMKELARVTFDVTRFPRDFHGLYKRNADTEI